MLSEKEMISLVRMLDDPDEVIASNIIEKLTSCGRQAIPLLESIWELNLNPIVEQRILSLKQQILEDDAVSFFSNWRKNPEQDILDAWLHISELFEPLSNKENILNFINKVRFDAWMEMNDNLTTFEKCNILIRVFQQKHQISIITDEIKRKSSNYLLPDFADNKSASRTTIAIQFQYIANTLGIKLIGLNFFEYAILGYLNPDATSEIANRDNVLFYIVFGEKISIIGNKQLDLGLNIDDASLYTPASQVQILHKIIYGLQISYTKENCDWETKICKKIIKILS